MMEAVAEDGKFAESRNISLLVMCFELGNANISSAMTPA